MNSITKISVIIRALNEAKHIKQLLNGIKAQITDIQIETILVDSGSFDSTVEIAKNHGVKILEISKEEFSFGRALNRGCEAASGDILLFASAHVYPIYFNWIEKMLEPFTNDKIGLVYGRQVGYEGSQFSEMQIFNTWFPAETNLNQNSPFCNNANCAIRKELWKKQPFDENLTGLEDLDWAKKIIQQGFQIAYVSDAIIVHVHNESIKQIRNRYFREAIALKQIMPNVNLGLRRVLFLFFRNVIADALQAIHLGCFFKEIQNIIIFRFQQFYGTYLGYKQKEIITEELKNRFYYPNPSKLNEAKNPIVDISENRIKY